MLFEYNLGAIQTIQRDGEINVAQQNMSHSWYIAIEGAIGVGKTTLARMLRDHLRTGLLLEVFEENPFLSKFYESRAQYAFQTQMFFLLSRYRQQHQQIPQQLAQGPLISDYMFAKDWLFARLNLAGDEWEVYQQIHSALAEQIPIPDLLIYLQADTDVLMGRITQRDRPYERDMDRDYIDTLRQTYEQFFTSQEIPVLTINTNSINFVTNPTDFQAIVERVQSALQVSRNERTLPPTEMLIQGEQLLTKGRPLSDLQKFHIVLDRDKGFITNMYFNYLCLSEEIGELASELAKVWIEEETLKGQGHSPQRAHQKAVSDQQQALESELADCMAYLLKMANYAGIDLETAYLQKMDLNRHRVWRGENKEPEK
jgi:deoxyguanosine kinase